MGFKIKLIIGGIVVSALLIAGVTFGMLRWQHRQDVKEAEILLQRELPPVLDTSRSQLTAHSSPLSEINLPVPFTPQAPHANWKMPYQEACEEAAALMAIRYVFGNPIDNADDADAGIKDLVRANEEILRYPVDQTAEQLMELILEIDPAIPVSLVHNPSIDDLKQTLSQGKVIIVPAAGRKLKNPFYVRPGPVYHMLVLRGYTDDGYFITNDPGTKRGEGYLYPFDVMMEAMGDWNGGRSEVRERVVLVLERL